MGAMELSARLMEAQKARRLAAHAKLWQPSMTPASDLGYACERRTVYHRVWPMNAESISDELASIFEEGNLHQADVRRELSLLGFEAVEVEVNFKDPVLEISGTIDCKIALSPKHHAQRVTCEIKSLSGSAPKSAIEMRTGDNTLLRRYEGQLQTYLYLTNEPEGVFIFKDKITGLWSVVPDELDYSYCEVLLKRAERIRDAVRAITAAKVTSAEEADKAGLLPARLADRSECTGCPWHNTLCHPAEASIDPLMLVTDDKLITQLTERSLLDPAARLFDKLDQQIKTRFKLTAGDRFVVGDAGDVFLVTKKVQRNGTRILIERIKAA